MHSRRILPFTLILLLLTATSVARADKVDDYAKYAMTEHRIVGMAIVVVKDGKVEKAEGYGMANLELNIPAKAETVFKIGSCSKQFLATGIMLLAQDGKLSVDDKVSKYLEGTPETWKDITIRHFLTHTFGVLREAPGFDPFKVQKDDVVIKTAYDVPLRFPTGDKWEYSNTGYFSLAEIITKVSGKPWPEFLAERVFRPLGMSATSATSYFDIIPNRSSGYGWQQDKLRNAEQLLAVRPSGGFQSTVLDMAKWDAALYGDKILTPASREQMWTPTKLNDGKTQTYGFGWQIGAVNGHKLINHGGSLAGFQAEFDRYVDDKLSVIVLTNTGSANPAAIAREVAGTYIPDMIAKPKFNIAGDWEFETDVADQKGTPKFSFQQEGNRITGKYTGQYGEADVFGTVEADKLQFHFRSNGTNAMYRGTISDKNTMSGQANYGEVGTWTGKRGKVAPVAIP